ncbi:MAG: ribonuclease R [Syntrophales bacterium]|nr:ribonuclease R [Syntrophales bacterium]
MPHLIMEAGYLVEFFDQRRILCGIVLELKGERLHVLAQTNRELTLARKRVLHACPSPLSPQLPRQQLLAHLEETARKREALKDSIQLEELWELLAQENQALSAREMADLWFGEVTADQEAALERALLADRFLFKYKENLWVPNPPEMVAQLRENFQREEERLQEMEAAALWLKAVWDREKAPEPQSAPYLVELMRHMAVFGPEGQEYAQGKAYLEKARLPADASFQLLVRLGVFQEDENLDLHRLEVPQEFSPENRDQAVHLCRHPPADPYAARRLDLTSRRCFTIDGERTRDFDDALSLEETPTGWLLGVHIAAVSSLVQPHTPLDQEAQERATSIYLPEMRLPMLPEEISENILSLLAGEERPALSFLVSLSPDAEILDWEIRPSQIRVSQRLTYQEVDGLLGQDPLLANLSRLTELLKERRLAQGGYELKLPEVWVNFTPQGEIQVTVEDQETPARSLVAEAMVLANWLSARFLVEQKIPAIYRSQPEPREPINREEPKRLLELYRDRRRLSRVVMDLEPQPHWGLGLDQYNLATSPIRRYLDLVTHRQLLAFLHEAPLPYTPEDLGRILAIIEPAMRRAGFLKTRRLRYWLLKYLAARVGQKKEALVLEALPHRYRLLFPDIHLEVFLPAAATTKLTPGDLVLVRLEKVNPREDQIKISLA